MMHAESAGEVFGTSAVTEAATPVVIRTPDQRLRVFVSSTLGELAAERAAVRDAIGQLRLAPVLFELGARPHPPRELYRAYLEQSHIFVGIYWQRYGWVAPGMTVSGLEDEFRLSGDRPKLIYIKTPASEREARLTELLDLIRQDDKASYKSFTLPEELRELVENDLAVLLTERFERPATVPSRAKERTHPSLPVPATAFVGREREIEEVSALLELDSVRLITLLGPGGIGKSRLALAVAERLQHRYPDGIYFVSLAALHEPQFLPDALARALGIDANAGMPLLEAAKVYLRDKRALLVLDNFEQILGAAPLVAELLNESASIDVLVTSRTVLKLSSEFEYVVPPLGLPELGEASLEAVQGNEAVRLFVARARAVMPGFELTDDNRDAIVAISRHLEGLPLAIELAAARVKFLPPAALLKRLGNRLDLLTGGARDLPDRQRTLRATLDWSFALLTPVEALVFTRLSMFLGGFNLEAAQAVCGDIQVDVIELLFSLADKSLLRHQFDNGEPRFSMLEIIREYAREKLNDVEAPAVASKRHRDYFIDFTRLADVGLLGHDQARWVGLVERENANIRAVLRRSLGHGEFEAVVEIGWNLWRYWWIRGKHEEGRHWMEAAIQQSGDSLPPARLVRAYFVAGAMAVAQADFEHAAPLVRACVETARDIGDRQLLGAGLLGAGLLALNALDLPATEQHLGEALQIFREEQDWWGQAHVLHFLWRYEAITGKAVAEIGKLQESVELFRVNGDKSGMVLILHDLAVTTLSSGDVAESMKLLDECFEHARELDNRWYLAYCFEGVGCVAIRLGDLPTAARYFGLADRLRDELRTPRTPFDMLLYAPFLTQLDDSPDRAGLAVERTAGRAWDEDEALASRPARIV